LNSPRSTQLIRFGPFELDLRSRELRKDGRSAGLPEQSIKVLHMLLERPGELVLREEIRLRLWPNDTVVEFDHSINTAIRKLRLALGDAAEAPRYIETLARRGYRWIGSLDAVDAPQSPPAPANQSPKPDPAPLLVGQLTGKRVSHYRVLEVLGGGGMGVVYKAEDLKLGRRVALKFLPDELAQDPVALKRLEQEARAASALNHPNVCTIYEIAEDTNRPFIVMEFLEGETLRELISRQRNESRRPSVDVLLDLAIEVCDALGAAHACGIVHRDIKPANIFVTRTGAAKILDFGVAKLTQPAVVDAEHSGGGVGGGQAGAADRVEPPLRASGHDAPVTRTGVTMGTAGYMSPEQVRGEVLDGRTDLFSLGLVIYELAAGRAAFGAATAALMRDAILNSEPPPARELNPDIPQGLARIIQRALEKDRQKRYQSAAEMRTELESLRTNTVPRHLIRRRVVAVVSLGLVLVAASLSWLLWQRPTSTAQPDGRLRQLTNNSSDNPVISSALSPDGHYLAYADSGGMHIKRIGADDSQPVPQPEALRGERVVWEVSPPAWFSDSTRFVATSHPAAEEYSGYQTEWSSSTSSIWVVTVSGGAPRKLRDGARAWFVSPDGTISFGARKGRIGERELWVMASDGGQARMILDVDDARALCCLYTFRGGTRIAYNMTDDTGEAVVTRDLGGGPVATLVPPSIMKTIPDFAWLADGRLIYSDDCKFAAIDATCTYWIEQFDIRSGKVTDKPRRLTQVVGSVVGYPSVTADGRRMTFQQTRLSGSGFVADLMPGATALRDTRHYTLDESDDAITDWTPDSATAIVVRNRGNYSVIYKRRLNATVAQPVVARIDDALLENALLSPDGRWVILEVWPLPPPAGPLPPRPQVWRVPIEGGTPERLFSVSPGSSLSCARAPATLCVIGEPTADRRQAVVSAFDPVSGRRGGEILRYDRYQNPDEDATLLVFALSADGQWLSTSAAPSGPLRILSLRGEPPRVLSIRGLNVRYRAAWMADGRALILPNHPADGAVLLHVDLQGNVHPLLKCECFGIPSPDGRYLGISESRLTTNVWMLENF
jgi:serine/threonine protein kinase